MNTFKLLLLTHRFYPSIGGTETNAEFLAEAMHKAGVEVTVITWNKYSGDRLFPYTVVRNPGIFKLIKYHLKTDLVFENHICLRLSWPVLLSRKPNIISLHTWINIKRQNLQNAFKQWWLRRSKAVIAVSNAVKKKIWPTAVVIENAYDDSLFKRNEAIKKVKPFVYLGRLVSDKGVDLLIEALCSLKTNNSALMNDYRLTIIGDGPEKEKLEQKIQQYELEKMIEFKGAKSGRELVNILNEHKYIVVPSVWEEPFGIVALEGMACGCIPIVSDGGGLPEAVGEAGIVFKRNDVNDLIYKMKAAVQDTNIQHSVKTAAPIKLKENTRDIVAGKYLEIFRRVLGDFK